MSPFRGVAGAIAVAAAICTGLAAAPSDTAPITHVLNRIGYGARPGDVERVAAMGLTTYIDRQLHPERLPDPEVDRRLAELETLTMTSRELAERYFVPALMERRARQRAAAENGEAGKGKDQPPRDRGNAMNGPRRVLAELGEQRLLRAVYSERQLNEVLVDFWFNHFNVFAGKGPDRIYVTEYERDVIRPRVLGKFRDLLGAVAESPAMLFYLDNWMSSSEKVSGTFFGRRPLKKVPDTFSRRPTGLNENYARELLELHTLGVDGGYTQKDVVEVARAFTGWTIDRPRTGGGFRFDGRMHDGGEKVVLGQTIRAGGKGEGERVLDFLAAHPSTARFIATKLTRRFVSDGPPAGLVDRAAARFQETGGDLRETVRVILTSAEFLAPGSRHAKVKTPLEFVVSAVRASGAEVVSALPLMRALNELGMPLYLCQPPTGYADTAETWITTGGLLNRMNFALALTDGRLKGIRVERDAAPDTGLSAQALGSPEFQRR
ncbi:MAG TPA: DUF1800 domain-containing protein [Vicinamibacterales bacterium]|jgi:uncharacterized protein (DUF1800 family)|nr:DUF1800 domain-containing protein [Vicinamibacterales bacterium]